MSDEIAIESAATPDQQDAATKIGWIPPERYKGDPERFVDADEYIKRGETVLPIVKEQNKRLQNELAQVKAQSVQQAAALKQAQVAIEQIEERHSVATQKAVERARAEVKAQLARASESGDHEGVAELTDQLTQLNTAEKQVTQQTPAAPAPFVPPPDLSEWNAENPWFGKDRRKTALALGIAQDLREGGEKSIGKDFFTLVSAEVDKVFAPKVETPAFDKVEGARNGGTGERQSGKKSWANLPAEAKAACKADARNFVGADKRYKTEAEWNNRYAEIYFEGE